MNFLTQEEITSISFGCQEIAVKCSGAILINAETIDAERATILRRVKELMGEAICELEELTPSDPDSFPTGGENLQPEHRE